MIPKAILIGLAIFTIVSILAVVFFKHRMRNVEHKVNTIFQMIRSYKKGGAENQESMTNPPQNLKITPDTNKKKLIVPSSHTVNHMKNTETNKIVVSDDEGGVETRRIALRRNDDSGYSSGSESDESTDDEDSDDSREVSDSEPFNNNKLSFREVSGSVDLSDLINRDIDVLHTTPDPRPDGFMAEHLLGLLSAQVMEINTKTHAKSSTDSNITVEEIKKGQPVDLDVIHVENEPRANVILHSVDGDSVANEETTVELTTKDSTSDSVTAENVTVEDVTVEDVKEEPISPEGGATKTVVIPQTEVEYSAMKAAELKRIAAERGHTKLSRMSKKNLVELLSGASE